MYYVFTASSTCYSEQIYGVGNECQGTLQLFPVTKGII